MKRLYLLLIFCLAALGSFAQVASIDWGNSIGASGDDIIQAITVDGAGNVYIAGSFASTVDFDPGSGTVNGVSNGNIDAFVAKYSPSGALLWLNTFGSTGIDEIRGIAIDATSVAVTGYFTGTVDFDDTSGSQVKTATGGTDIFLAEYGLSTGVFFFVNAFGSVNNDYGAGVSIDALGNVYMAANFTGSVDFDPSGATQTRTSLGGYDMVLAKFGGFGAYMWASALGSTLDDVATACYLSGTNIFISGGYKAEFHADPNFFSTTVTNLGNSDGYFGQYTSSAGALVWGGTIRSSLDDGVTAVWGDGANLYTAGYFTGTASVYGDTGTQLNLVTNGGKDAFLARHTLSDHKLMWANKIGGGGEDSYNWMTSDGSNLYVTGVYSSIVDLDPSAATANIPYAGGFDAMSATYAVSNGAYLGGSGTGGSTEDQGTCVAVDASRNIYFSGMFTSTIDVDPSVAVYNKTTSGLIDGFFGKYSQAAVFTAEATLQPTALVFSEVNPTSYDYDFTASAGINIAGHVGIKKAGSLPTFIPTDGVPLTAGSTNSDGSIVDFIGTGTSWTVSDALPETTYYYSIYAYNGSSTGINYRQPSPLTGSVTTEELIIDETPPAIVDNTPTSAPPNSAVKLTVTATDNIGVTYAYADFAPINTGESGLNYADLVQVGNTNVWEFTIPASNNTEQGLEYNVYVYDDAGNSASTGWKQVLVAHPNDGLVILSNVTGSAKTDYRIISIPLTLTNKSVNDVFSDDIGPLDKTKYRLFKYENKNLGELISGSSIEIGKGYWFIATDARSVDSGPGTTVNAGTGHPFTVPIVEGWNLIGNPFNSNVAWSIIRDDADNDDVQMGQLRVYKKGWQNGTTLEKFSGGFIMVQNDGDGVLHLPVIINDRRAAPTPENFIRPLDSDIWAVDILLRSGETTNTFGGFGMHPNANEQNDRYDDFTLPRFMDYLELNYKKTLFGSAFTKDIVPTTDRYTWEFQVESNLADEVIDLTWDNSSFGTSDRQLVLWDIDQQRAVGMKTESNYAFQRGQSGAFKIFFGDENFVKTETMPFRAVFHSASPVPSSGNVTLAFSVPETSGQINTNISIYNLMGQKMADLVDQPLPGGYQQAVWNIEDGTKPAAGMYISVLKFGDTTLQKRLIIK